LSSVGLPLLPRDQFAAPDGAFDACLYAEATSLHLGDVAASLGATGLEAISLAYPALSHNQQPIGTGPFRFVSVDGLTARFDAFDGYHFGRPAADGFEVRVLRTPEAVGTGAASGTFDWAPVLPAVYVEIKDAPGLQFASYPDAAYGLLAYNLRPGSLFAEHRLRSAVELCIDKPATVDAATNGTGDVIYSPIDPISWAFQPDLRRPERNVAAARGLIETAGWTEGSDGIYVREDRRLAADVYVDAGDTYRTTFVDLVAEQVRDCGIELKVVRADSDTVLNPLFEYPHIAPGSDKPFEAVFLFFLHGFDPNDITWSSRTVTSTENPDSPNFMGFANSEVDRLIDEGVATYDQRERARIYRQLQEVLAEEQPVLFGWGTRTQEALDSRLRLTDGPINLDSRMWWWQLEKLTLSED
jgi:peptide/nickel transport system substrate-binding protein